MEREDLDELASQIGKNVEEIGRMLHGRGRKYKVLGIDELIELQSALSESSEAMEHLIETYKMRFDSTYLAPPITTEE